MFDIQIAQKIKLEHIKKVAAKINIEEKDLEFYGKFKAKLEPALWQKIKNNPDGKLILVTAINPTPAGEGKTTTSIGLNMALNRLGKKSILAMREASLGPCFGIKGGACGGGYAQVVPMEDINLHFTGDIHAVTTANNLLSALIDNHLHFGNKLNLDPRQITWKRALDMNDRSLRNVVIGLGGKIGGVPREENFQISVASEVMAILCLARDLKDLKDRLGKIIIGYNFQGKPIFAKDLKAEGPLSAVLKDAIKPNLVQDLEHNPVLIHGGPFANIAHGCSSILATKYGLKMADYLVTEAGFGADLGAEKFFNIKCRLNNLKPDAVVLVATIRSLKYNGGVNLENLNQENLLALEKGLANLNCHVANLKKFGLPVLVAINQFDFDSKREIELLGENCKRLNVKFALSQVWEKGGLGGQDLAEKLLAILKNEKAVFKPLYEVKKSIKEKINAIAKEIYGAKEVNFSDKAKKQIAKLKEENLDKLPICIAKTQYSFSDNPKLLGAPEGFVFNVREIRISSGAGFIVALAGEIATMPGLPAVPAAEKIDVDEKGVISGLF